MTSKNNKEFPKRHYRYKFTLCIDIFDSLLRRIDSIEDVEPLIKNLS